MSQFVLEGARVSQPRPPCTPPSIDGAIQAFDGWPPILHEHLDPHQDSEHRLLQVGAQREGEPAAFALPPPTLPCQLGLVGGIIGLGWWG